MQIDSSFASWRDCFSVSWVSGATGHGLGRILKRVTQLIPKWSLELGSKELDTWRRKMAVALAGTASVSAVMLIVCLTPRDARMTAHPVPSTCNSFDFLDAAGSSDYPGSADVALALHRC